MKSIRKECFKYIPKVIFWKYQLFCRWIRLTISVEEKKNRGLYYPSLPGNEEDRSILAHEEVNILIFLFPFLCNSLLLLHQGKFSMMGLVWHNDGRKERKKNRLVICFSLSLRSLLEGGRLVRDSLHHFLMGPPRYSYWRENNSSPQKQRG